MDNDKKRDLWHSAEAASPPADTTSRARNRTVMLSPEMTGQMRARIGNENQTAGLLPAGPTRLDKGAEPKDSWDEPERVPFGATKPEHSAAPSDSAWPKSQETRFEPDYDEPQARAPLSSLFDERANTNGERYNHEEPAADTSGRAPRGSPILTRSATVEAPPSHQHGADAAAPQGRTRESAPSLRPRQSSGHEEIIWKQITPLLGFLVSFDHDELGSYIELRSGRLIVTSEGEASSNCLLIRDDSVSPMHAIMRVAPGGTIQILDQLSETGTRIRRPGADEDELLSGEKSTLSHGDIVMFGERKFHVCLLTMSVA